MDVGLDPFPGSMASSAAAAAAAAIKEVEERERGGKKGVKGRVGLHGWSMVKEPKTDTVVDEPSHTRAVSSFCHADLTVTSSSNCSMTPSPSPSPPLYPPPSSSNTPPRLPLHGGVTAPAHSYYSNHPAFLSLTACRLFTLQSNTKTIISSNGDGQHQ